MSPVGNLGINAQKGIAKLHDKPEADPGKGRQVDDVYEVKGYYGGSNPCSGIENHVRAQNPRDGSRGSDDGEVGVWVDEHQ